MDFVRHYLYMCKKMDKGISLDYSSKLLITKKLISHLAKVMPERNQPDLFVHS